MGFSYEMDLVNNPLDRVRFEIGDTDGNGFFLHDAEINSLLSLHSADWQLAALAAIRAIVARLSRPDFKADWLQVSNKEAIASYRRLLSDKESEYGAALAGVVWFDGNTVNPVRGDVDYNWDGSVDADDLDEYT